MAINRNKKMLSPIEMAQKYPIYKAQFADLLKKAKITDADRKVVGARNKDVTRALKLKRKEAQALFDFFVVENNDLADLFISQYKREYKSHPEYLTETGRNEARRKSFSYSLTNDVKFYENFKLDGLNKFKRGKILKDIVANNPSAIAFLELGHYYREIANHSHNAKFNKFQAKAVSCFATSLVLIQEALNNENALSNNNSITNQATMLDELTTDILSQFKDSKIKAGLISSMADDRLKIYGRLIPGYKEKKDSINDGVFSMFASALSNRKKIGPSSTEQEDRFIETNGQDLALDSFLAKRFKHNAQNLSSIQDKIKLAKEMLVSVLTEKRDSTIKQEKIDANKKATVEKFVQDGANENPSVALQFLIPGVKELLVNLLLKEANRIEKSERISFRQALEKAYESISNNPEAILRAAILQENDLSDSSDDETNNEIRNICKQM